MPPEICQKGQKVSSTSKQLAETSKKSSNASTTSKPLKISYVTIKNVPCTNDPIAKSSESDEEMADELAETKLFQSQINENMSSISHQLVETSAINASAQSTSKPPTLSYVTIKNVPNFSDPLADDESSETEEITDGEADLKLISPNHVPYKNGRMTIKHAMLTSHYDNSSSETSMLLEQIETLKEEVINRTRKIKTLNQKVRRKAKRIATLKKMLQIASVMMRKENINDDKLKTVLQADDDEND